MALMIGTDWAATVSVAVIVSGVIVGSTGETSSIAVYSPGIKPLGLTDKLTLEGVAPDVGLRESHLAPSDLTDTRKPTGAPALDIAMFTGLAVAPNCCAANDATLGEIDRAETEVTIRVTGSVKDVPDDGVMTTWPVYVPGGKPPGFTAADTVPGVAPPLGLADSHPFPPFVVLVTTV